MNNFWPEYYKYLNSFVKSAAPYRDNTVPVGSVLDNNIKKEINDKINRSEYTIGEEYGLHPYLSYPNFNLKGELSNQPQKLKKEIEQRFKKEKRKIKKETYKELQPRPGQPLRDYQKAQTENYNALVNDTIKELHSNMQYLNKRNAQVTDFMPTANNASGTVGGRLYGVSRFGNYNKNFRRTNNAYKNIESERQALLPYVPEQQKNYVANIPVKLDSANMNTGTAGTFRPSIIRINEKEDGTIGPGAMIHEGIHGLTITAKDTPVARKINTSVVINPDHTVDRLWKNKIRNEFRSINGTDSIFRELSKEVPTKKREKYSNNGSNNSYKNDLYIKAGINKQVPEDLTGLPFKETNKLTNNIIKNRGINVSKILDIEPADKEWNNTYAQGFGKAYKENPEAIDWLMEEKTKNYRLKPTATGKDRWNRASKKNKKSSILDNIEIALEKDKNNADLLDWYKKNREGINYQYGVAKSVDRHERKAKRKKLDRKEWEARRKAKGKTAGYYPAWLQYIYS